MTIPSDKGALEEFVERVWLSVLGRAPDQKTLDYLVSAISDGRSPTDYFLELYDCEEAQQRRAQMMAPKSIVAEFVPPGHYYSPVVDPAALRASSFATRRKDDQLLGLQLDFNKMTDTFVALMEQKAGLAFPAKQSADYRYYHSNDMYGLGDALILASMIRHNKPRRIIEVGSGFSSAVMLDVLERSPELATAVTLIEPYVERLESLLRSEDLKLVQIIQSPVQEVPTSVFEQLESGDILFLDTTHISKTGSDVNYEVFEILPRLKEGVIIHFHDVFDGFEYLDGWIFEENRSWNELYLIRAFLMYNTQFEVIYANHAFSVRENDLFMDRCSEASGMPGGGLWLRRRSSADSGKALL